MVRTRQKSDDERLHQIMVELAERHHLTLHETGWSRKTYDLIREDAKSRRTSLLIRVESFAIHSGEIRVFHEDAWDLAKELAREFEEHLPCPEAVLIEGT